MAKKSKTETLSSLFKGTTNLFRTGGDAPYIPSILEFCYSAAYLGFSHLPTPVKLYPIQQLVLRAFYRGSPGNTSAECMIMTEEEEALCKKYGLDDKKNGNILKKWNTGSLFKELVLVWGRRSGKDFTISIIALYEAMKLLEAPGGDPYKLYHLANANPFTILTIANSSGQAKILYNEIRAKLLSSPYFKDKFIPAGITGESIYLLTPQNKIDNEKLEKEGIDPLPGSVVIQAGHSNSNTLVGKGCYVLLLDEVAAFKQTGGSSSGDQIYGNLSPTIKTYVRVEKIYAEDGVTVIDTKHHYDGKIISISSPRGMDGVFYNLYEKAETVDHRLMCRLPTWVVAPDHSEQKLREEEQQMTEEKFNMEYGAEFSGTEGENFFPPESVLACFEGHDHQMRNSGVPGPVYFAHLDPAISSHNYALCVVHKHVYLNRELHKLDFFIIVDHVQLWTPEKGKPIQINKIDDYMMRLNRLFHLGLVTYDQWNSAQSIENLRKSGIPAQKTIFNKSYKIQIYDELYSLVTHGKLKIPHHKILRNEMLHLQRKFMNQGYRIYPKSEGEVRTDDCVDALAGACFNALKTESSRLPLSRLVNMGISPQSNGMMWKSMSGNLGYGTGGQVAHSLEQRASYPRR